MSNEFAKVVWKWQDIQSLMPEWTEAECVSFLEKYEKHIQEAMLEAGWEAIETLLPEEV